MHVGTSLRSSFVFFDWDPMCVSIGIVADAGYLPGDFRARFPSRDPEPISMNFFGYVEFWLCPIGLNP